MIAAGFPYRVLMLFMLLWALAQAGDFRSGLEAYERGDYHEALMQWEPLAHAGDARAQTALGRLFLYRQELQGGPYEARKWFDRAAAQGEPDAQYHLAYLHVTGIAGAEADWTRILELFRHSAEGGHPASQFSLGYLFYVQEGPGQDFGKAVSWYRRSADQGFPYAQHYLAGLYFYGDGVSKDLVQSYKWFLLAERQLRVRQEEHSLVLIGPRYPDKALRQAVMVNLLTVGSLMSKQQREEAHRLADAWRARPE